MTWPTVKRPLVAILRGVQPDEVESIVETLIDTGFETDRSAAELARSVRFHRTDLQTIWQRHPVGAGTVLTANDAPASPMSAGV